MRKSRFTDERKGAVVSEHAAGADVAELRLKRGIPPSALFTWRSRYSGMCVPEVGRLSSFESGFARPKVLLAEAVMEVAHLRDLPARSA